MTSRSAKEYHENTGIRARTDLTPIPRGAPLRHDDEPLTDDDLIATARFLDGQADLGDGVVVLPKRTARKIARACLNVVNRRVVPHA